MIAQRRGGTMEKQWWLLLLGLAAALLAAPAWAQDQAAQRLADLVNADRAAQGLPALKWDPSLAQAAQQHAQLMSEQGTLSHQYPGEPDVQARAAQAGAHFRTIAENVAMASSPEALEKEWMKSPPHRANILNSGLTSLGVGIVRKGGNDYASLVLASSVANLGPEQIEQKVGQLLQQRHLELLPETRDARQTCEMEHGSAGGSKPWFVMRWEGTDLSRLPDVLEQKISSGRYHKAAVGACDSGNAQQGFTTYKIAVLLY
jgi:hypothetical protein